MEIPDKLYFKIGEVAALAGVEPYVLRYWETEFKEINPVKSKTNQRLYRRKDIEAVLRIKQLLYEEGFTIDGARKKIRNHSSPQQGPPSVVLTTSPNGALLKKLKRGLEEVVRILEGSSR